MLPTRVLGWSTQKALRNAVYSEEEVLALYKKILQDEEKYTGICRKAMGVLIVIIMLFQGMLLMKISKMPEGYLAFSVLLNLGGVFIIYWYLRYFWIYSVRRQFLHCIKKSYPQIHYDLTD